MMDKKNSNLKLLYYSRFSQMHKISNIGIIAIYLQFPSLFTQYDISECEIKCQWVLEDYIRNFKVADFIGLVHF